MTPYPRINRWIVPQAACAATLDGVAAAGLLGCEAGAFWLGRREAVAAVTCVAVMRGRGIVEEPGRWIVSPAAYGAVASWARPRGLVLLGTAHTHGAGIPVGLSSIDRKHLPRAPGILAVVVVEGGAERDPHQWAWNVFDEGAFVRFAPDVYGRVDFDSNASIEVVLASADGVRPRDTSNGVRVND